MEYKAKSVFDQLTSIHGECVAILIGADPDNAGFRNRLRDLKPLPDGFILGDVVNAYAKQLLKEGRQHRAAMKKVKAASAAE